MPTSRADLPAELVEGLDLRDVTPLAGGDIASAYRLDTADGPVFCKTHSAPTPGLFEREAAGLRALREHAPDDLHVPQVLRESPNGSVLEWIPEGGRRTEATETTFGTALARLHRTTNDTFGGLDGVEFGYLGSAQVDLTPSTDWAHFYVDRRVGPLIERAIREGRLDPRARDLFERVRPHARSGADRPSRPPSSTATSGPATDSSARSTAGARTGSSTPPPTGLIARSTWR